MQKFVVKKSKSSPLPASASSTIAPTSKTTSAATTTASEETTSSNKVSSATSTIGTNFTPQSTNAGVQSIVSSKSSSPSPSHSSGSSQMKMSGYLKKKRNTMGGWRKLWFVLQNQLLLSYSSKEDYEKKLAPFKDVLNLVPGTIIRPTRGPRFIIETSTNQIYTYRCDNNKVCSEWVTALVESLALHTMPDTKLPLASSKLHFSMENLPKSCTTRQTTASSCLSSPSSSFLSSQSCDSIYRSNFAKQTPKLPVAQSTARILERVQTENRTTELSATKSTEKISNFRLHHGETQTQQHRFEVHRINRMFSEAKNASRNPNSSNSSSCRSSGGCSDRIDKQQKLNGHRKNRKSSSTSSSPSVDNDKRSVDVKRVYDKNSQSKLHVMDSPQKSLLDDDVGRMSLETSPSSSTSSKSSTTTADLRASISKLFLTSSNAVEDMNLISKCDETENCCDETKANDSGEPIYAVVNLKNKYARRAKQQELGVDYYLQRERPNSVHVVSSDYEEVFQTVDCVDGQDDDENIYEPINIPEMSGRNPLWRYFSKINIDALTDMTRWRRDTQTKDETSTFSDIRKRFGHHRKSIKNKMKKLYTRSHSDSIDAIDDSSKVDGRQPQHATCSPTSSSDGGKSSPEANQNATDEQFRKRDRHLFGSMLKKSRTSFCFEDSAPKKKLIMASAALKRRMCADKKNECHSKFYD